MKDKTLRNIDKLQADFRNSPGHHSKKSPVVGTRANELQLIYRYKNVFAEYQEIVYSQQQLNVIPVELKARADEISKKIYAEYIIKYSKIGLTIENSLDWTDTDLTRTYLSTLENEWNTWKVEAVVAKPNNSSHVKNQFYRPAYICALHELMHVEETSAGILEHQNAMFNSVNEVLTVTRTLILIDEVYKKTLNIDMDIQVDYGNTFNLFGRSIQQGELANFYRKLDAKYPSLAEALVSKESLQFLGQTEHTARISSDSLPLSNSLSMMVLSGFIAAVGIAIVALAFISLNAATGGVAGLVLAGVGSAAALSGIGLFAFGSRPNSKDVQNFFEISPTLY
ncbi:hypothetical protein [Legionella waltersii]|uniref:Uncharacterized protein n=1 Tax=Legionella waltersii TaxID=66969 RepID=A0A0W1AMK7_9GAMM|nr:hypothetical protein [Legionella waltersii]KTD82603.1 hypothetical protein Lwal_0532 [Legionella waltersii]SNV02690.1 Uncharacterised protein [Legionella waltersii]